MRSEHQKERNSPASKAWGNSLRCPAARIPGSFCSCPPGKRGRGARGRGRREAFSFIFWRFRLFAPPAQGCWDDSVLVSLVRRSDKPLCFPRLSRQMKAAPATDPVLQAEVASGQLLKASFAYMQMMLGSSLFQHHPGRPRCCWKSLRFHIKIRLLKRVFRSSNVKFPLNS